MSSLLVGGGAVVLRRDLGSSGAVQGFRAGQTAVYGAKLSTGVSGVVLMQAGGAAAQLIYAAGVIYNVSVLEALAVLDGFTSSAIFSAIATDGIVAADPFGGQTTATRLTLDSVTGLDNLDRQVAFNLSRSESVTGSETIDADVSTPGVVNGAVTDSVGAADAITVSWVSNASVTSSITASDTESRYIATSAAVSSGVTVGHIFDGYLSTGVVFDVTTLDSVFATDELIVEYFSGEDNNLKLSLAPILSLYRSAERLNSNFEAIQEAFQNTLSRDGSEPNNMLDDMDMDSHRITNLGAPVDDNDAVRLIDLTTYAGGGEGGGGTVTLPTDLTLTRTSTTATVVSSTGTDATIPAADSTNAGVMTAADKIKLDSVQAGATDDQTGAEIVTAINAYLGSTTWQGGGGTGGSTNLTFNRTIDTVTVLSDTGTDAILPEATNLLAGVFTGTNKAKLDGIDSNATANEVNFVKKFGGVGNGTTNNDAAIALAEASAYEYIYLPEGDYVSTVNRNTLAKKYIGPGKIILAAYGRKGYQSMSAYTAEVASSLSSGEYGTNEKMTFSDFDYRIIANGTRRNFDRYLASPAVPNGYPKYFWAPSTPRMSIFQNNGGWSGTSGILASTAGVGATTAVLNGDVNDWSTRGLIGQQLGFSSGPDGIPTDLVTVTAASGSTITFTPALTNSYPAGSAVSHGYRTMNTHELKIVDHNGGGDAYAYCARVTVNYPTLNSQQDTFYAATGGLIGGDLTLTQDGNYGTGWECYYADSGKDGSIIGSVNSYARQNNTAARTNSVWLHDFPKMDGGGTGYEAYGLKPLDGVWVAGVAARTGLDLTRSAFSVAAVALPLGQRIGFDAETAGVAAGPSNGWGYVASTINNMFIRGNSDAGGKFLAITNDTASIILRPTVIQVTKPLDVGANYFFGNQYKFCDTTTLTEKGRMTFGSDGTSDYIDWFVGSTYRLRLRKEPTGGGVGTMNYNGNFNLAGDLNCGGAVTAGGAYPKFAFATGVYIYWDGANIRATKDGGITSTLIY